MRASTKRPAGPPRRRVVRSASFCIRHGIIAVVTDAEILAAAAVFAGGACHSATGFGFVLVAGPLVVAALPPEEAITTLLLLGILMSSLTLLHRDAPARAALARGGLDPRLGRSRAPSPARFLLAGWTTRPSSSS